jgi:hypothetical protein
MPYHNGISIPSFIVTFLLVAVGRTNLAYGMAADRRLATLTKPLDLSPRPWHIITVAVRVEHRHERVARPVFLRRLLYRLLLTRKVES